MQLLHETLQLQSHLYRYNLTMHFINYGNIYYWVLKQNSGATAAITFVGWKFLPVPSNDNITTHNSNSLHRVEIFQSFLKIFANLQS
jgi:hypothetical protein